MCNINDKIIEEVIVVANGREYKRYKVQCQQCGNIEVIPPGRLARYRYCSRKCAMEALNPISERIKFNCQYCSVECEDTPYQYNRSKNHFCSHKCADKFNSEIKSVYNKCVSCGKWFKVRKSMMHQISCSRKCQGIWQSKNLVGKNANNYKSEITDDMRNHNCDWCGKETTLLPYDVKRRDEENKSYFCSKDCYREWYAKDWSQQEEWKIACQERAVGMLVDGTFGKTDTEPQLIVNNILNDMSIRFENEYNCKIVAIDNYLVDYNLMIEVNGTYWHCDPRVYKEINYQAQYDRIINDKRKSSIIKSQYGINILYLWEKDLTENPLKCEKLIQHYVECKGELDEYNSFNYVLNNEELVVKKDYVSFMEIENLQNLFFPTNGEKRSYKQIDKWIAFDCEQCGIETEQLKSRYIKNKHHFCSPKCSHNFRIGKKLEELRK